jgi:glycosyltransferase involved in cell wall biosynthesis
MHLHYSGRPALLLAAAAARRRRNGFWLLTVHSHALDRVPRLADGIVRWGLNRFDRVIAVAPEIAATLEARWPGLDLQVIPAYLPPMHNEVTAPTGWAPSEFVLQSEACLIVSAYRVRPSDDGGDLYGIDRSIDMLASLKDREPRLRLAIFLSNRPRVGRERRYLEQQLRRATGLGLRARVTAFVGVELVPAFVHPCSVYLRPTRTDGDAVSVREALDLGVPVIASDVVQRPSGAQVLSLATPVLWADAIEKALRCHIATSPCSGAESWRRLMAVYSSHLRLGPATDPDPHGASDRPG